MSDYQRTFTISQQMLFLVEAISEKATLIKWPTF